MKLLKTSILTVGALFAMSNFAGAETVVPTVGHGYSAVPSSTTKTLHDGSLLIKQTSHGVWIGEPNAANFPLELAADCRSSLLLTGKGANIATRGTCIATDIDGDVLLATNGASAPDFSDCTWEMYGGTGKYAGVTGSGACALAGPFTKDGTDTKFSWSGKWILP